jgi:hypothetical protein
MKNKSNKRLEAERKANHWLAKANELAEAGKDDSRAIKEAQKWLDRLNEIEGK